MRLGEIVAKKVEERFGSRHCAADADRRFRVPLLSAVAGGSREFWRADVRTGEFVRGTVEMQGVYMTTQ